MSFQKILDKYRKVSFSERDKGDRFERLMQAYLKTDPKYAYKFKKVWLWNEFPARKDFGGTDTGIDIVALTHDGDYWAVQCKFYQEDTVIDKPAVDSFLATSSRTFKNEELKTTSFAHRLWISTTNRWGSNATEALSNQNPPVTRLGMLDLNESGVDWDKLEQGIHGENARTLKKTLRPHQQTALENAHEHFKSSDRGKLIMACGTGKTFTALRIAEHETNGKGLILFLVPSIALLGQTLREWSADANEPINAICICSDPKISAQRKKNEDSDTFSIIDLALPASTDTKFILHQFEYIKQSQNKGMTVVFSTYQSIDVLANAQKEWMKKGFPEFDLIICDEAHRTTGVSLAGEDESAFTKVHDNSFIQAKKRLYMTATPRLYSDDMKSKAAEVDAVLCSMDDDTMYGDEFYHIGFGEAVERKLLTDYKVLILTLSDKDVPASIQKSLADENAEISADDATKLVGTINALSKQFLGDQGVTKATDPEPMRRAVAFCSNVAISKKITAAYNITSQTYLDSLPITQKQEMVSIESKHMDGTMAAPIRDEMLSWLKEDTDNNECRVITNVRVLSEGVDVPSLDAVLFLSPRNSQVDVVQSVGRVMRRAEGKKYGYIIIPVVVPADIEADIALDKNQRYKVVWTVLNALRAHDDRFNATVNKIELNRKKPDNILIGRTKYTYDNEGNPFAVDIDKQAVEAAQEIAQQLSLEFEQLQSVMFARMVQKVGDRRYWEQWAKDVALIAERQIERITYLVENRKEEQQAFKKFLSGLQKNINPSIDQIQAIEMLAQHIITKPIFEALFEGYSFVKNNAVSTSMQSMLDTLHDESLAADSESLQKFYESVRKRAEGIDNAEGKQRIIIELYDTFFKAAFPKMAEQLGIVYTPIEVVDFILHSVNDILKKEFGRSISDENIHILDPFTGTGTFMVRLLQSGLIKEEDLERKYKYEMHANEMVLLAYYIASINIENAYHDATPDPDDGIGTDNFHPFEGIVLTDTFQLGETYHSEKLFSEMFPQNSERVEKQKKAPIRVIVGNPPYSVGQRSANDNAQNQSYPKLDSRISDTYAKLSSAGLNKSLYDSYIKAFRWSTDRLGKDGGIICYVSNGAWLDGNSTDGFRKRIEQEFSLIYVFNLRGNARTTGELNRKEGHPLFGATGGKGGSKTPISITLLVKNPKSQREKAKIYYHDIGDYLKRGEKLKIIQEFKTFSNVPLKELKPNEYGDWINKRNDDFLNYIPLAPDKKFDIKTQSIFNLNVIGIATNRDAWVYNFSNAKVTENMQRMIAFYNEQTIAYSQAITYNPKIAVEDFIDTNPQKISWTRALRKDATKNIIHSFKISERVTGMYRPFTKQNLYYDKPFIESPGLNSQLFPIEKIKNIVICISPSPNDGLSLLIANQIPDLHFNGDTQAFPLYYYEENKTTQKSLFDEGGDDEYIRRDAISDFILDRAKQQYGKNVSKEDIFYYVYGFLHSKDYRETFANDLKKMLPRLPLVDDVRDFWAFSKAGRKLAELHLDYEKVPAADDVIVQGAEKFSFLDEEPQDTKLYLVKKMRFPKKNQKDTIIYNSRITISNIPEKAYEYVVNGKSAIEWIMERYQITTHKASGITNDPNDWAREHNKPRYILDLLLSIINVSVQTVDIVNSLPKIDFETDEKMY